MASCEGGAHTGALPGRAQPPRGERRLPSHSPLPVCADTAPAPPCSLGLQQPLPGGSRCCEMSFAMCYRTRSPGGVGVGTGAPGGIPVLQPRRPTGGSPCQPCAAVGGEGRPHPTGGVCPRLRAPSPPSSPSRPADGPRVPVPPPEAPAGEDTATGAPGGPRVSSAEEPPQQRRGHVSPGWGSRGACGSGGGVWVLEGFSDGVGKAGL